ncbi:unnamed protein product [Adineta steineri]|uniref:DUF4177 domain-containing protein n=1 Tax=Adineta steineri TaxID=433720 RepID=A0A814K1J3_9BILA|nr:unnamed protein product [Adineta steineri]CAF1052549.1 unnamed protein product [Adineta steineri]CAF1119807.1 unnamed protein product [Adineta steineri]
MFSTKIFESKLVTGKEIVQREYEYRIVTRQLYGIIERTGKDSSPINEGELNKYGQEGWELCGLINANFLPGLWSTRIPDVQMVFKRFKAKARSQSG